MYIKTYSECTPPEVLAPAGDPDALRAAIKGGADAVYLGVGEFNARQGAKNFEIDELRENIELAHSYGVKVFLALNIPLKQDEMQSAIDVVHKAYSYKIDAIILEDLGLFFLLKKHFPDLPLHASTQMTIHNPQGVDFIGNAGASRVILSRELTTDQVKSIIDRTNIEIELFVHGALCYSFSGRCLFSTAITDRSANRGACFQPCRRPYKMSIDGEIIDSEIVGEYPISCAELCTFPGLADIIKTGVKSLKIEGRMKKPEYVTASARTYKAVAEKICKTGENFSDEELEEMETELAKLFYRGFTRGFVLGEKDVTQRKYSANYGAYLGKVTDIVKSREEGRLTIVPEQDIKVNDGISINTKIRIIGCRIDGILVDDKPVEIAHKGETATLLISPKTSKSVRKSDEVYVSMDPQMLERLQNMELMTTPLTITIHARKGEKLKVEVESYNLKTEAIGDYVVEEAKKAPTDREQIITTLAKLGDTTFHAEDIILDIDDNIFIPLGVLSSTRREAVDELFESRFQMHGRNRPCPDVSADLSHKKKRKKKNLPLLSVEVADIDSVIAASKFGADIIYAPIRLFDEMMNEENILRTTGLKEKNIELVLMTPAISFEEEMPEVKRLMQKVIGAGFKVACSNYGTIQLANELGTEFVAQKEFNPFNAWTLNAFSNSGAYRVTLSTELNLKETKSVCRNINPDIQVEIMVYGRELLLETKNDLLGPLFKDGTINENSEVLLIDNTKGSFPVKRRNERTLIYNSTVLDLMDNIDKLTETGADVLRLDLSLYGRDNVKDITRNFRRALEGKQIKLKNTIDEEYDQGHYFKGVL
ncbi:U32 family peptidase [Methanolobus bombayensis]|uniref:U32 family peptidase n=1 Tax=Methanolobus bombayensis TaxID=38023 RepID=UPI001AEB3FAB|nr:U32 family peptidase [Methanolobus bombayensis]MBP1908422.1 putative protease [Methanolobus bombayensis]